MKRNSKLSKRILSVILSLIFFISIISISNVLQVSAAEVSATVSLNTIALNHNSMLQLTVNYNSGANTISNGDKIVISIDNSASDLINISGFGDGSSATIYGEDAGNRFPVGTRTYSNDSGNYTLTLDFDNGYQDYYGGGRTGITGFYTASVWVKYEDTAESDGIDVIYFNINGIAYNINVTYSAGNGTEPGNLFDVGSVIGKSGRQGATSGNLGDMPKSDGEDISEFDIMRWSVEIGMENLLLRDLRANALAGRYSTNGNPQYWTTPESIEFSNNNVSGQNYNNTNDPYLYPVSDFLRYTDEPFHIEDAVYEDFCDFGEDLVYNYGIGSPHDFVRESLRIIRIIGRVENKGGNKCYLIDGNFLKDIGSDDPVNRFLPAQYKDKRGLTIQEFLTQLQLEGQFVSYGSWEDILQFDYVKSELFNGIYAFDQTQLVPHFKLQLGNLYFNSDTRTIDGVYPVENGISDFPSEFALNSINAKNLPYAYYVYYDTEATDAWLATQPNGNKEFKFFNVTKLTYNGPSNGNICNPLWAAYEGSGGSATPTYLSVKKVNENGDPIVGVEFTLTKPDNSTITRTTTQNGTFQFPINSIGDYTLAETGTPAGLIPMDPISFTVDITTQPIDLTDFKGNNDITFDNDTFVNTIVNYEDNGNPPPPPKDPDPVTWMPIAYKTAIGDVMTAGQFEFTLYESDSDGHYSSVDVAATATNDNAGADSDVTFDEIEFTAPGTFYFILKETSDSENDWIVDTTDYLIKVVVTEAGGNLSADATNFIWDDSLNDWTEYAQRQPEFVNTYTEPEPVIPESWRPEATKKATGATMLANQFKFTLYESDDEGLYDPATDAVETVGNGPVTDNSAHVVFKQITYQSVDTYYYVLKETSISGGGWTDSTASYLIKVDVTIDPQDSSLVPIATYWDGDDWVDYDPAEVVFINSYSPASTAWTPAATKTATGGTMTADQFEFTLYESDEDGNFDPAADKVEVVKNGAITLGVAPVEFSEITYSDPETFYYVIKETNTGGARWSANPVMYLIKVTIADNGHGTLAAIANYWDGAVWTAYSPAAITFNNTYTPARNTDSGGSTMRDPEQPVTPVVETEDPEKQDEDADLEEDQDEDEQTREEETILPERQEQEQISRPGGADPVVAPNPTYSGSRIEPGENGIYLEIGEDGTPLGEWRWDEENMEWVFEEYPPLAFMPKTGHNNVLLYLILLAVLFLTGMTATVRLGKRVK